MSASASIAVAAHSISISRERPKNRNVPGHKGEVLMPVKHKITVSIDPHTHSPTTTERRAALTAAIAGEQQNLKREAAERRAKRAR